MADYNLLVLPVLDHDDRLIGVLTIDDILEATIPPEWRRRREGGPKKRAPRFRWVQIEVGPNDLRHPRSRRIEGWQQRSTLEPCDLHTLTA